MIYRRTETLLPRMIRMWLVVILSSAGLLAGGISAQERPSTFQICMGYVTAVEELQSKYLVHQKAGQKLITERNETLVRLAETQGTLNKLVNDSLMGNMQLMQAQLADTQLQMAMNERLAPQEDFTPTPKDVRYSPGEQFQQFSAQVATPLEGRMLAEQLASLRVQMDRILHELTVVRHANHLAVQRYRSLVKELREVVVEMTAWHSKSVGLFEAYWELADVAGVRSDLELRSALHVLRNSPPDDLGATFVAAIALMRLERHAEALPLLERVLTAPAARAIALAARAELYMRLGEKNKATLDLRNSLQLARNDPRVRIHRAQALAAAGQLQLAEKEWESVLKLGGHEIAAHRAIALINASIPSPSERNKSKAIDNAMLASQLAGDDWACEAAVALAAVAGGDAEKAKEFAENASELAIGGNQAICHDMSEKIEAGEHFSWQF